MPSPADFAHLKTMVLATRVVPVGNYLRIYKTSYIDATGMLHRVGPVESSPALSSRFSDPNHHFSVLYFGASLDVCFLEAVLRDNAVGIPGPYRLARSEISIRNIAVIKPGVFLNLLELTGNGVVKHRIPTDAVHAFDHAAGQMLSSAVHQNPARVDGMAFPSRHNGSTNIVVFERAFAKIALNADFALGRAANLARTLDTFNIEIFTP